MTPAVPPYVKRHHHSAVVAIQDEPGRELVNIRRSDKWSDGWRCSIYRYDGGEADPVKVADATAAGPLEAFRAAVALLRGVTA